MKLQEKDFQLCIYKTSIHKYLLNTFIHSFTKCLLGTNSEQEVLLGVWLPEGTSYGLYPQESPVRVDAAHTQQ